jgi:3-dehydroquinate synthase
VRHHLSSAGLPTRLADVPIERGALLPLMRTDKKNEGGALRLVLVRGIGEAFLSDGVAEDVVAGFLERAA